MNKSIYILFYLCSCFGFSQVINFPDANLKSRLLEIENVDANFDNEITQQEAAEIEVLDLMNSNIANLSGLEYFLNLKELYLSNNNISELNISMFNNLAFLDCSHNQISSMDFSNNTLLAYLNLSDNMIANLDLTLNVELVYLDASNNDISAFNTANSSRLNFVSFTNNPISDLNIDNMNNLQFVSLAGTNLNNQDILSNENIWSLSIDDLNLATIDLSNLSNLRWINASNGSFADLDFGINSELEFVDLSGNSSFVQEVDFCSQKENELQFVFVEETPITQAYLPNIDKVSDEDFIFQKENNAQWLDCSTLDTNNVVLNNQIVVYPNPTLDKFVYLNFEPIKVEVYAMNGKRLLMVENKSEIEVHQLPNGVYLTKAIDAEGNTITHKLIVSKANKQQF